MIPLDLTASAIFEMRNSPEETLNLVHPKPASWNSVFEFIARELGVPMVSYSEWVSRLEAADSPKAAQRNSALRLLDFYKSINQAYDGPEAAGFPTLSMDEAKRICPMLADENLQPVGPKDAKKWLSYWNSVGAL